MGYLPAVVYGRREPRPVQVELHRFEYLLEQGAGHSWLFTLDLPGEGQPVSVVLKELQRDPVTRRAEHADFLEVDLHERVRARIPLVVRGEEELQKHGGIAQLLLREVEVEGLPQNLPAHLEVDVSSLAVGQHLEVSQLSFPDGVGLIGDPDAIALSVTHSKMVAEEPPSGTESQP